MSNDEGCVEGKATFDIRHWYLNLTRMVRAPALPRPLPRRFYDRSTLEVARDLIGKLLVRRLEDTVLIGRIVETEAYIGEDDPACHAARGLTARTRVMYGPPGFSYVYFTYGMYFMLNVVCERAGFPAAVLIRAVEPVAGLEKASRLRKLTREGPLTNGPGKLCREFSISTALNGADVTRRASPLQICQGEDIATVAWSTRVGIRQGKDKSWRCFVPGNPFVSPGKISLRNLQSQVPGRKSKIKSRG